MKIVERLLGVEKRAQTFVLSTNVIEMRILFLTDDIVRIRAGFTGDFAEESYSLVMTAWEDRMDEVLKGYRHRITPADAVMTEDASKVVLQGTKLKVVVQKDPFLLQIYDEEGTLLHEDIPYRGWLCDSNGRRIHTCVMEAEDDYYGFGERTGQINKREAFMQTAPGDCMGYNPEKTDALYKHIPFYLKLNEKTKKAVGYFYHTTWECDFNMGRSHSNYTKHHSTVRIDGGDIDLFFIAGPTMKEIVSRYTDLTGKSVMLPKAALGYLGSSMYYPELPKDADEAIVGFVDTAKKEQIPMDGFQLSSGYCEIDAGEGMKRYTFTWNHDKFKDPADHFKQMTERGITVSPNVKPGMLLSHPYKKEMEEKGMFVKDSGEEKPAVGLWWGGMGNYVDYTKESVRGDWKQYLKDNLLSYGVTSVWNDNCEYEGLVDKDARVSFEGKGATIGQVKPVMSNLMCQLTQEAVHEEFPNTRAFAVCRSGHAGIQRYAQTWAGDNLTCWESLKYNIATILGMGLSGVANHGCDIGGFYGTAPEEELFVRWVQNGIFQPRFSIHSTNIDNTVTEPWMYSGTKHLIRDAIQFRYRLSPYMYALMARATKTGAPIMEPLVYAFQEDAHCYNEGIEFMLGDSLLVANVVEKGASEREIYLPEGTTFYDFYTREAYEGGQTITIPVTLSSIPMFVKSGSIVPVAENQLFNLATEKVSELKILCVPDEDATFDLYDDDGATLDYEKGVYCNTHITMHAGEKTTLDFAVTGSYENTVEKMHIDMVHREKSPYWVQVDGKEIEHFLYREDYEAAECGWYYSQTLKSVQIKYPNIHHGYQVVVSFEAFDLIGM